MRRFILWFLLGISLGASSLSFAEEKALAAVELEDTAGVKHLLANYHGKWVLVNYWATWCPPCLEEIPDLVSLYDRHKKKDLMVLGIVFDYKDAKEVADYASDMSISYPIVLGSDEISAQIGPADVLPTTYIYNPKGELVKIKRGLITKKYVEDLMAATKANATKQKSF